MTRAWVVLVLAMAPTVAYAQDAIAVDVGPCAASWFEREAFERALSVELAADGARVEPTSERRLALDVPCADDAPPIVALSMSGRARAVSLVDLPPSVRMRALALASHDFVREVAAQPVVVAIEPPPVAAPPSVEPRSPSVERGVTLGAPVSPVVVVAPRWLGVAVTLRGMVLGLRVVAPMLSVEGRARVLGTPLELWIAIDGLYASGADGLGEVRAFDVGGRVGARLVLELAPVELSVSAGLAVAYGRGEGIASASGTRASAIDGAIVGIDVGLAASVRVSSDVRLLLSGGVLGFAMGFDARAEDRPIVSFRDVAPWLAVGVVIDLPP